MSWTGTITTSGTTGNPNPIRLKFELKRDPGNVTVGIWTRTFVDAKTNNEWTIGGWAEYDEPGFGNFTYSTDITLTDVSGNGTAECSVHSDRLFTQIIEYRR